MIEIFDLRSPFRFKICILYFATGIQRYAQLRNIRFKLKEKNPFFNQFNEVSKLNVTQVFDNIFTLGESSNCRFVAGCELSDIHL